MKAVPPHAEGPAVTAADSASARGEERAPRLPATWGEVKNALQKGGDLHAMKCFTQKRVCYRQPGTYDMKPPRHGHSRALPAAARGAQGQAEGPDLHCRAFPAQPISQTPSKALTRNEVKKEWAILCHQEPGAVRQTSAHRRFSQRLGP